MSRGLLAAAGLVVAVGALAAAPAHAQFRFLCNGINANGSSDADNCGPCNASTAARWEVGTVAWHYDESVRPSEVSASRWANEIAAARANWNAVMGLSLVDGGNASFRQFGSDNGENEIFWITSASEWDQKVGGGVNSALGVTITQNRRCFGTGDRDIFDADVVMNGAGFDWSPGNNSSLSTLAHEMGHGLGLGHPCASCDQLMSATSGFDDPDGPQAGDIAGVQALYPAPGLVGSACSGDFDCDGNLCANVGDTSFCTQTCGTCPNGMVCFDDPAEGNICIFSSSEVSPPGGVCGPPGCADACDIEGVGPGCNFCINFQDGTGQCFAGCNAQTQQGCGANEACSTIFQNDNVSGVCVPVGTAVRGQPCGEEVGCVDGLLCAVTTGDNQGVCIGTCDNDTGAGCLATENCFVAFTDGTAACFPAGTAQEGEACDGNDFTSCGRGLVCLSDDKCYQRCDQGFSCADDTQSCVALTGGDISICDGGGGEGEGEGEPGEGEGEEPPPPEGQCRIKRGNFDCAPGDACELENEDDSVGTCTGEEGDKRTFEICEDNEDCRTGLCEDGVCTRPCDEGDCPDAYECDEDKAPPREPGGDAGICVPESCQQDHGICDAGDGFQCVYSDGNYVCAKDGKPVVCAHTSMDGARGNAWAGVVAVVGIAALSRRRRRA